VTIHISNRSSAVHEAGTNTSKRSSVNADFYDLWDKYTIGSEADEATRKNQNYRIGGGDDYRGVGSTSRKSRVEAKISAVISEILNNGNLVIVGEHSVNINDETEILRISGVIRQSDITPENTVDSHQIANAKISVKGDGVVGSKQTPGILTKMFNWVF